MATETAGYTPFTEKTVVDFLVEKKIVEPQTVLEVNEIGDGNLNYVFRIQNSETGESWIVKQALPYAKVVGESWPLTLDRARIESEALQQAHALLPQHVPLVHHYDDVYAATIMEDLSHHTILRKGLIAGNVYPDVAHHIGTYLAHTLFFSSDYGLVPAKKKELATRFVNPDLCGITESLVFTDPFYDAENNNYPVELQAELEKIWHNDELLDEIADLKHLFLTKGEALLHGDLHTGSVFVTETSTKVIDPEFAFYGPAGFDVGAFIANISLSILSQRGHREENERESYIDYLSEVIHNVWSVFETTFRALWDAHLVEENRYSERYLNRLLNTIFSDAIGFAGTKIIRRTVGLAHVEDIDSIEDSEVRLSVQKEALSLGTKLILNRHRITSIEEVTAFVKGEN